MYTLRESYKELALLVFLVVISGFIFARSYHHHHHHHCSCNYRWLCHCHQINIWQLFLHIGSVAIIIERPLSLLSSAIAILFSLFHFHIAILIWFSLCFFIEIDEDSGFTSIPTAFYWVVITMTTVFNHPQCQKQISEKAKQKS